jgi:hypothetical protein
VALHALGLECSPYRFHQGIVPAVAFATHAEGDPVFAEERTVGGTGILAAPITMMDETICELATTQGRFDQRLISPRTHCPTHQQAGIAIHDARQIQPALLRPNACDIRDPFLVRPLRLKVTMQDI